MVKVSVVMPVYNASDFLEKSFSSFFNQTLKDIELICVDDGSTDDSLKILKNYESKYDSIHVFTQENKGSGKARNYGMDKANGEYIAFLDADDIFVDETALEKMYNFAIEKNADMVGANLKRVSENWELEDNFNYAENNYAYFSDYDVIKPIEYGIPWAFYKNIFKRSFLNEHNIRFPDLKRGQDPVLLAEVLTQIKELPVVPVDLYGYNYGAGGGANFKVNDYEKKYDYIMHFKETFFMLEKGGFNDISDKYKEKLVIFLNLESNKDDIELHEIIQELFKDEVNFDYRFNEDVFLNNFNHNISNIDFSNFNKYFKNMKIDFFNASFTADYFIPTDLLRPYLDVSSTESCAKISLYALRNESYNLALKNEYLYKENLELEKKIEDLNKFNEELLLPLPPRFLDYLILDNLNDSYKSIKREFLDKTLSSDYLIPYNLLKKFVLTSESFNEYNKINSLDMIQHIFDDLDNQNKLLSIKNEDLRSNLNDSIRLKSKDGSKNKSFKNIFKI